MSRARRAGARDPATRAALKDYRIQASTDTSATSLEGSWRDAFRCTLRQSLERYDWYPQKIAPGDTRIAAHLLTFDRTIERPDHPLPTPQRRPQKAPRHAPKFARHTPLYRLSGVDLTRIDGLEGRTAPTRIAESGLARRRWKTEPHFAAWLGFCPDPRISGGTVRTRGPREVVNRAADALRLAAPHLLHRNSALGATSRRLRARRGAPQAITAMAHTRARRVYRLLNCGQPYVDKGLQHDEARFRQQRLQWLQRQARALNRPLVPNHLVPSAVS